VSLIRYDMELVLILLLVEPFLKHRCLDTHRGNRWKLPRETETRCSANKPVEAIFSRELCSMFAFPRLAQGVHRAHPCDVVRSLIK